MSARLLDGRELAKARRKRLAERVDILRDRGISPRLAVILPNEDDAALAYFRTKARTAERLGIEVDGHGLKDRSTAALVDLIHVLAADERVSGLMIEAPIPPEIDMQAVRQALPAAKDVDGAGTESLGLLLGGQSGFAPATAAAALTLAETVGDLTGKHAVVIGRSLVVGRPLALLLLKSNATVTVAHSETKDLDRVAREADVVFVAVGRAGFLTADMVKPGATVIDIGTNVVGNSLVGDVDACAVEAVAGVLSPVPGGVGPMTTALLLEHVVEAAERAIG